MNPFGISETRIDPIELARWNAGIQRARRDYYAHPISTAALGRLDGRCVDCGKDLPARRSLCGRCAALGEAGRKHK